MAFTNAFRESTTFQACAVASSILFFKFASGGLDFGAGEFPVIGATEFGIAFAGIWAIWCNREWRKAKHK